MAPSSPLASASAAITAPQCCRAVPVAEITQLAAAVLNAEVAFVTRNDAGGASVTARFGTCADDIDIVTILAALSERDGVIAIGDAAGGGADDDVALAVFGSHRVADGAEGTGVGVL